MMTILSGLVLALLLTAAPASAGVDMQEGAWETVMELSFEGAQVPMSPSKVTSTQCLTRKDLVPSMATTGRKCTITDRQVAGNAVSWKVRCEDGQERTEGEGTITYAGSSYEGVIRTRGVPDGSNGQVRSQVKMRGRRVGDCAR